MLDTVEKIFVEALAPYKDIVVTHGKKVYEIRPPINWNKGEAIKYYTKNLLGDDWVDKCYFIYIGDDTTDEDVFRIIGKSGLGILVSESIPTATAANCYVENVEGVYSFLQWLAHRVKGENNI